MPGSTPLPACRNNSNAAKCSEKRRVLRVLDMSLTTPPGRGRWHRGGGLGRLDDGDAEPIVEAAAVARHAGAAHDEDDGAARVAQGLADLDHALKVRPR